MHRGRSLDVIVSAEITRAPWERMVEPERYGVASLVAELVDAFCEPEMALADIYELLTGASRRSRARTRRARCCRASRCDCSRCSASARRSTIACAAARRCARRPVWLDAEAGGVVDRGCRERWRELPELEAGDLENLRGLARPRTPARRFTLRRAAAAAVEELVAHHLGRRPKASAHLDTLGA